MTIATVTHLDDERLIREGEAAVDLYNRDIRNARTRIMPMARGLCAAERKYPATQELHDWLLTSSYRELGPTDRAALIKIGESEDFAAKFMQTTSLTSPELIWDAIRELRALVLPAHADIAPTSDDRNSTDIGVASPNRTESDPPPSVEAKLAAESPVISTPTKRVAKHSYFYGLPRAAEVQAIYTDKQCRTNIGVAISERGGKEIWSLILQAIDHGFLTQTDISIAKVTARILFPKSPRAWSTQYDLTVARHRVKIRDVIMPAAIANRQAILAAPDQIEKILSAHAQAQATAARQATAERKTTEAVQQMPSNECQIMMFGQLLWPRLDDRQGTYDFDQIRAAVWSFRDLEAWNKMVTADNSVGSRAIRIRLSTKWYGEYLLRNGRDNPVRKVISLVHLISRLMEQAPEAECRWPPYPTAEAQW